MPLTKEQIRFVKKNRLLISAKAMAAELGVGYDVVKNWLRANGLTPPKDIIQKFKSAPLIGRTSFTKKEDNYIKRNYLKIPLSRIADNLGRSDIGVRRRMKVMGLVVPPELIEQRRQDSRIKPGNVPFNKGKKQAEYASKEAIERTIGTRFKKGHVPTNAKAADGEITIRTHKGTPYKYIRVSLGKWKALHVYKWEQKHGPVPKGHCVAFKDGNSLRPFLKNLELITRAENLKRNDWKVKMTDDYLAYTIAGKHNKHLLADIKQDKALLAIQKGRLLLKRAINEKRNARQPD